jgi:glycosyltransferase involved in cell wall biosynthesis
MSRLVSVVVPAFNAASYLPDALDSALAQDYAELEVIVVDDGSTDTTAEVAASFASRGVKYVRQANAGPGPARDLGVQHSNGSFVAFLDSDDTWLPGKLARQVAHFDAYPNVALVSGAYLQCNERNEPTAVMPAPRVEAGDVFERLLVENFIGTSTAVVRKSCLVAAGGFGSLPLGQDWDTWLRMARRFAIGFVPEVVARRRAHRDSISHVKADERLAADAAIVAAHLPTVTPAWRREFVKARSRSTSYYFAAAAAAAGHDDRDDCDRGLTRSLIGRSMVLDPLTAFDQKAALLLKATLPRRTFAAVHALARTATGGALPRRAR